MKYYTRRKLLQRRNFFVLRENFLFWPGKDYKKEKVKKNCVRTLKTGEKLRGKGKALSIFMFNEMNKGMKKI